MSTGWAALLEDFPWFTGEGRYRMIAYSEFMPPPRVGRLPYGEAGPDHFASADPYGWRISEQEQEFEFRPGLERVAAHILDALVKLGTGAGAHALAGHEGENLRDNPYWPPELAGRAGRLAHEHYVVLLPLAFARTQDDMGHVRWSLFGSSEQGPERAFWQSFYTAPGQELPEDDAIAFCARLLAEGYGEHAEGAAALLAAGLRILPAGDDARFRYWSATTLPAWTRRFAVDDGADWDSVRYLLTFRPFSRLPEAVRRRYLSGKLHLLPFPGSLALWGMPTYRRLQEQLPLAMQIPALRLVARHSAIGGMRVPQSGWLHEPRPGAPAPKFKAELLNEHYARHSRWSRHYRYEDPLAAAERVDRVTRVLFSTDLGAIDLYDKPMARNSQIWTRSFDLVLDGPRASRAEIDRAEAALAAGGLFAYRFLFPAMRAGRYEVYWQRPLVACVKAGKPAVLHDALSGYLTAYRAEAPDPAEAIELWPRLLRRELFLSAARDFDGDHDHWAHQTAFNLLALLDAWRLSSERPLGRDFARALLRIAKDETLERWLDSLPQRARDPAAGQRMREELERRLEPPAAKVKWPAPVTYAATATRAFEEAYWRDIAYLAQGRYVNKDNADCVQDDPTQKRLAHHQRDLEQLGDYLIERHQGAIDAAGMSGRALVGELPFEWDTDFDFAGFGGWVNDRDGRTHERNILVVIPGKQRGSAVIMADHYDTAYMEDVYYASRGGTGARLSAPGADDNCSATAALLQAAPLFLTLAQEGRLERDVWLLHLTGEEFPADSMGARALCRALVERTLALHPRGGPPVDLRGTRVDGLYVLDMVAHNRENDRDVFQISPGRGAPALGLAWHAHVANLLWNAGTREWNRAPERAGQGRGRRSADPARIPAVAEHLALDGEVRTAGDPTSSLFNTDGLIFSDTGVPAVLFMENYDINRSGYHDSHDTLANIDLDYGAAVAAIAIEAVARAAGAVTALDRPAA